MSLSSHATTAEHDELSVVFCILRMNKKHIHLRAHSLALDNTGVQNSFSNNVHKPRKITLTEGHFYVL